jgi:hypothetical protein
MLARSRSKYSLLLTLHPYALFPHVRYLDPQPAQIVVDRSTPQFEARRRTIDRAAERFSLVLDADTRIPAGFVSRTLAKLDAGFSACTLRYAPDVQKHPPFGASLWHTETLQQLYDYQKYVRSYRPIYARSEDGKGNDRYDVINPFLCECLYMWPKLRARELYVFSDLAAEHLRPKVFSSRNASLSLVRQ